MAHLHDVLDDDPHFKIDANSREIIRTSEKELLLIQDDHNSERCTFDIPKFIDGHDMALCNVIRVHFINVNAENPTETSLGLYEVDDLRVSTDDPSTMVFSWLISSEGTALIGTLSFLVEFICKNDEDVIEYSWHTGIYTGGIVSKGMNNSEIVIGQHYDVLNRWVALIEQEGDRVRTDVLNRINTAATTAETNSINAIDEHAETVKKDLALYGLDVSGVLVQETGYSEEHAMSQKAVTEEFDRVESETNTQITNVHSELNAFKTEIDGAFSNVVTHNTVTLATVDGKTSANIEVGKIYLVESDKTTNSWGFDLKHKLVLVEHGYDAVLRESDIMLKSTVDEYATTHNIVQILGVELEVITADAMDSLSIKYTFEINGERFTQHEMLPSYESSPYGYDISPSKIVIEGCTKLFEVFKSYDAYVVKANGITSITKTNTAVVDGVVTHTFTILLDDGTTTTFDVKDGVGIASFGRYSQGITIPEDEYKITLTNGEVKTFKVPNNNSVGIVTSDSGPMIHAEDLIPLDHVIHTKVRSKNMIPYPYNYSYGLTNGVTFTRNEDGSITAKGTVVENSFANVIVCKSLSLTDGKTYYLGNSPNLLLAYKDDAGVIRYLKNQIFTWKKTYEFIQLYLQYSPGVTVDETVYPMLCESNVPVDYTPYVDPTTITLTRCGKNLLKRVSWTQLTENGITFTRNSDGSITVNGTATSLVVKTIVENFVFAAGVPYTLSGCPSGGGVDTYRLDNTDKLADDGVGGAVVYTTDTIKPIRLRIASGASLDNLVFKPQLEVGDFASSYESYRGSTYDIDSMGNPTGIVRSNRYPIVNLLADKTGVIIDATYNVDQTAAYNKINALLETLLNGGA